MCSSPSLTCNPAKANGCTQALCSLSVSQKLAGRHSWWRGSPLIALFWWLVGWGGVGAGLVFLGPSGTETIGETVLGRLLSPGHSTNIRLKHILVFLWKRPIYSSSHLQTMRELLGNVGHGAPSLCSPLALLQFTVISQKRAYILIWSPNFHDCHTRDTCRSPSLEAGRVYDCSPTGLYKFA